MSDGFDRGDTHNECSSCGGRVVDALELPGGDVVHADDVPYSDGVRGVDAIQVCRQCGVQVEVDSDV